MSPVTTTRSTQTCLPSPVVPTDSRFQPPVGAPLVHTTIHPRSAPYLPPCDATHAEQGTPSCDDSAQVVPLPSLIAAFSTNDLTSSDDRLTHDTHDTSVDSTPGLGPFDSFHRQFLKEDIPTVSKAALTSSGIASEAQVVSCQMFDSEDDDSVDEPLVETRPASTILTILSSETLTNRIYFNVTIEGIRFTALLDTGAQSCAMTADLFDRLPDKDSLAVYRRHYQLVDSNGKEIQQTSKPRWLTFSLAGKTISHPMFIVDNNSTNFLLLGQCFLNDMSLSVFNYGPNNIRLKIGHPDEPGELIPTSDTHFPDSVPACSDVDVTLEKSTLLGPLETCLVECRLPQVTEACLVQAHPVNTLSPLQVTPYVHAKDSSNTLLQVQNMSSDSLLLHSGMVMASVHANTVEHDSRMLDHVDDFPTAISPNDMTELDIDAPGIDISDPPDEFDVAAYLKSDPTFDKTFLKPLVAIFDEVKGVIARHDHDYGDINGLEVPMPLDIVTTSDEPIYSRPYRLDPVRSQQLEKGIRKLVATGLLFESTSNFTSPCFLIHRKGEHGNTKTRLIFDYRRVNSRTVKNRYPLPCIQNLLQTLGKADWYTLIDIRAAFYAVSLTESASKKSAVITEFGIFCPTRMTFGLCNAPNHFADVIRRTLSGLRNVHHFQDDVLIATPGSIGDHLADIKAVLLRLQKVGFKVNGKGAYCKKKIKFLGKIVQKDGCSPLPSHVNGLKDFPPPGNLKQLQQFIGVCNWLSSFIPNFSAKMAPFTDLLNGKDLQWNDDLQIAFERIKNSISESAFLYFIDQNAPVYLCSDASGSDFASFLYQCTAYSAADLPQLRAAAGKPELLPAPTLATQHPVLPPAGAGVPRAFPLQADPSDPSATATHLLAAVNVQGKDLSAIMRHEGVVYHVKAIAYHSGVFKGAMVNYSTLEKEATALVLATEQFSHLLQCASLTYLVTDAQSIVWLLRFRNTGVSKLERLIIRLLALPFHVVVAHIPGRHNPADLFTRTQHYVPPQSSLKEAKKAIVVKSPFPVGEVVEPQTIIAALLADPGIVASPPHNAVVEGQPKVDMLTASSRQVLVTSLATLEHELSQALSHENILHEQRRDEVCRPIIDQLQSHKPVPTYVLTNDLLCRVVGPTTVVVAPSALIGTIIALFHSRSHSGAKTLLQMIQRHYYIPDLRSKLSRFTKACHLCIKWKANTMRSIELGCAPLPTSKLTTWHMDLVTGFPSIGGLDGYLSLLDPFSGFRLAIPIRSTVTAKGIAAILRTYIIQVFGPPEAFVSDGGSNLLRSDELRRFCAFHNIRSFVLVANHSPSHGRIEVTNKSTSELVNILSDTHGLPWLQVLGLAVFHLNSKPRCYFEGLSPNEIVFGRNTSCPPPQSTSVDSMDKESLKRFWSDLHARLDQLIQSAYRQMVQANLAAGGHLPNVKVGSHVFLKNYQLLPKRKVRPRFHGIPFVVLHDYGHTLLVKGFNGVVQHVHKSNCKYAPARAVDLFGSLPTRIKAVLGPPYTPAELQQAIDNGTVPEFWQDKAPTSSAPRTRLQRRLAELAEQARNKQLADAQLASPTMPLLDDSDSENDDPPPATNPAPDPVPKSVRFA